MDPDSDSNVPDRHSAEMSVINGLKNLKDFQREITLLNIEKLLGQTTTESAKKERSKLLMILSLDDLFNLFGR